MSAIAWSWHGGNEQIALFEGRRFRDSEIPAIQTAFACADLDDWRCEKGQIYIPRRHRAAYLQALDKADAIRSRHDTAAVLQKPSLLDTRQAREQKQRESLQIGLSKLIESIRGVDEATVRYSEHVEGGLHRRIDRRALVAARAEADKPLSAMQIQAIRQSIVASVAGLDSEDVTITDLNYPSAWSGAQADALLDSPTDPAESSPVGASRDAKRNPSAGDRIARRLDDQHQFEQRVIDALASLDGLEVEVQPVPESALEGGSVRLAKHHRTPPNRAAVDVRGNRGMLVRLTLPETTLQHHFGGAATDRASRTAAADESPDAHRESMVQAAAVRLQPLVQRLAPQPVAVLVTASRPSQAKHHSADSSPQGTPFADSSSILPNDRFSSQGASATCNNQGTQPPKGQPGGQSLAAATIGSPRQQPLWVLPLVAGGLVWLLRLWRQDLPEDSTGFLSEARDQPQRLAALLEQWIDQDESEESIGDALVEGPTGHSETPVGVSSPATTQPTDSVQP